MWCVCVWKGGGGDGGLSCVRDCDFQNFTLGPGRLPRASLNQAI